MSEEKSQEILEMENIHVDHSYTADDIQVLEGLEAVRKRPECISEAPAAEASTIWYGKSWITVSMRHWQVLPMKLMC